MNDNEVMINTIWEWMKWQLRLIHDLYALDLWPPTQSRWVNVVAWPTTTGCATAASCNGTTTPGRNCAAASSTPDAEETPTALTLTAPVPPSATPSTLRQRHRGLPPSSHLTSLNTSIHKLPTMTSRKSPTQVLHPLSPSFFYFTWPNLT